MLFLHVYKVFSMGIKITEELNAIISYSKEEAMRTGCYLITPDHLFLGIIRHSNNAAISALKAYNVDINELKDFIDSIIATNQKITYSEIDDISFSRTAQNTLSITLLQATVYKQKEAGSQHLLLALLNRNSCNGQKYLTNIGITQENILNYFVESGLIKRNTEKDDDNINWKDNIEQEENKDFQNKNKRTIDITTYGYDLTKAASEGKLDPITGRDEEISRVIEILGRRKKNNPMLIGDPGVGKSAIIEGLALKIACGDIPDILSNKKIISIDIASIVAGSKYRGEFEQRIKDIITTASSNPNIILFIDEFHTIVGAGGSQGSLDAANIIKPSLARGDIRCIGATTTDEFRKIIEKDGALDRRFQKIEIQATDTSKTIKILNNIKEKYEIFHKINYTSEAIEACVKLTDRYMSDKVLPDKAIDTMDEAGAMVHIKRGTLSETKIPVVNEEDIAEVVSKATGIPINRISESEGNRIIKLKDNLKEKIIGQDNAIDSIISAIRRNRSGLRDPKRPIGSFLFLGSTGVGKTRLAKCIAENLFDSSENFVRIDMSEYMEKFSASRLIGAPPGYVGYEEGGQLTKSIRRHPYSVVLLDEIEKAHPDIFNLLLQVMDDGRLTDSEGRTVDFHNTIIIMTSNVGSRDLENYGNGMGFITSKEEVSKNRDKIIEKAVRKTFSPEFLNRIDETIYFNSLTLKDIEQIIDIELKELFKRSLEAGYKVTVSPTAKKFIAKSGFDNTLGARPLKRAIIKYVEDPLSEFIIFDRTMNGTKGINDIQNLYISLSPDKNDTIVTTKRYADKPVLVV